MLYIQRLFSKGVFGECLLTNNSFRGSCWEFQLTIPVYTATVSEWDF